MRAPYFGFMSGYGGNGSIAIYLNSEAPLELESTSVSKAIGGDGPEAPMEVQLRFTQALIGHEAWAPYLGGVCESCRSFPLSGVASGTCMGFLPFFQKHWLLTLLWPPARSQVP